MLLWDVVAVCLIAVIIFVRIFLSRHDSGLLTALLLYPGTVLHEVQHFWVGLVTGASPTGMMLVPKRRIVTDLVGNERHVYTLGSVACRNLNCFNAFPVAMAPLFLLVLVYILWSHWQHPLLLQPGFVLAKYLLIYYAASSAIPSPTDFSIAFRFRYLFVSTVYIALCIVFIDFFTGAVNRYMVPWSRTVLDAIWT